MKKVTIMALHLGYGGVEKAITSLVNNLSDSYDVTIVSVYDLYDKPAFQISDKVKIKYLLDKKYRPNRKEFFESIKKFNIKAFVKESISSFKILYLKNKEMIEYLKYDDSDIIISTRITHNYMLGKYGYNNALKIAWEHNHHNDKKLYIRSLLHSIKKVDNFVLVSKELKQFYQNKTKTKCVYIPNMIDDLPKAVSTLKKHNLVSIGRLSKEKGYEDLIYTMFMLKEKEIKFHLNIIGDGPLYDSLKQKISELELDEEITLKGFQNKEEIGKILMTSSIYLMSSYTESFGIVLLEAMSYGIPCIAFDSAQGANELIKNKINGYLIKERNQEEMVDRVIYLLSNYDKRKELGQNGYDTCIEYTSYMVMKKWLKVLNDKK